MSPILILDGGLGTTLEDRFGIKFSAATTPLWSSHILLDDTDILSRCHAEFAVAGADIITTATYQFSISGFCRTVTDKFSESVLRERMGSLLEKAINVAQLAQQSRPKQIAMSFGPYGATMIPSAEYSGLYDDEHNTADKLLAWHAERLALAQIPKDLIGRVNYVAFETIPRLDEIQAVRKAAVNIGSYWISVLYPENLKLPDGTSPEEAVRAMLVAEEGLAMPWGIGVNCTNVQDLQEIVGIYERTVAIMINEGAVTEWPALILYPDGTNGGSYDSVTQSWMIPDTSMDVSILS